MRILKFILKPYNTRVEPLFLFDMLRNTGFREDGSKIYVHQDKRPVTVENEHNENSGLKLEGVNKQDLESLHHGAELYDKMMPKKD